MSQATASQLGRAGAYTAALAVLAAVFLLYLQPDFMVSLAQQLWACF